MTNLDYATQGITLAVSLGSLAVACAIYRKSLLDAYQQDLYVVRNRLWDFAHKHDLLSDPAHCELRGTINGLIRMAPLMTLFVLGPLACFVRRPDSESTTTKLINQLGNPHAKDYFTRVHEYVATQAVMLLFFHSFPGCIVAWPALAVIKGVSVIRGCKRWIIRIQQRLVASMIERPAFRRVEYTVRELGRGKATAGCGWQAYH